MHDAAKVSASVTLLLLFCCCVAVFADYSALVQMGRRRWRGTAVAAVTADDCMANVEVNG